MLINDHHDDQAILDLLENPAYTVSGAWFSLDKRKKKLSIIYTTPTEIERQDFIPSAAVEQILRTKYAYKEDNAKYFGATFLHSTLLNETRLRKLKLLVSE